MTTVRALSVREPWASLIASGVKTIELRTWSTKYRGPLLICSGGKPSRSEGVLAPADAVAAALARERGVSVALVELLDVRPATVRDSIAGCSETKPNEFAWVLGSPRPLPAVAIKGQLGLFSLDLEALFGQSAINGR